MKCLVWGFIVFIIALAMVYGFYLAFMSLLFNENVHLGLTIIGEALLFCLFWKVVGLAEC